MKIPKSLKTLLAEVGGGWALTSAKFAQVFEIIGGGSWRRLAEVAEVGYISACNHWRRLAEVGGGCCPPYGEYFPPRGAVNNPCAGQGRFIGVSTWPLMPPSQPTSSTSCNSRMATSQPSKSAPTGRLGITRASPQNTPGVTPKCLGLSEGNG